MTGIDRLAEHQGAAADDAGDAALVARPDGLAGYAAVPEGAVWTPPGGPTGLRSDSLTQIRYRGLSG